MSPGVDRGFKDFIPEATASIKEKGEGRKEKEGKSTGAKWIEEQLNLHHHLTPYLFSFPPFSLLLQRWRMDCATKATRLITPPAIVKVHSTSALLRCIVARNITIPHFHPSC